MTSYITGLNFVEQQRRRPAITFSNSRQTRKVFGNIARKQLPIPEFINIYNYFINSVDTANQMRSYYTLLKIHRRTWKPLFYFLLDTTITNAYKLSSLCTRGQLHHAGHKAFCEALVSSLFKNSARLPQPLKSNDPISQIQWHLLVEYGYKPEKISEKEVACAACLHAGRKTQIKRYRRWKPLCELSPNTIRKPRNSDAWKRPQRAPRTKFGCRLCRIPLYRRGPCWKEHVDRLNSKE